MSSENSSYYLPSTNGERKKRGALTKREKEVLPQLLLDCRTYDFNVPDALQYISKRLGRPITYSIYKAGMNKLEKGVLTDEWLKNFAKVGFALVHQELFSNSMKSYRDTNLKVNRLIAFMASDSTKKKYEDNKKYYDDLLIRLKNLAMEQGKDVMSYTLGTPVIAQMKAMIRQEIIMQERQKLLEKGEALEDVNYNIMKNILQIDNQKGNIIIQDTQKDKYSNQNDDSLQRNTETDTKDRQVSDTTGQDTNSTTSDGILSSRDGQETRINPDTNYTIPDNTEKQKEWERLQQTERDTIF